MSEKIVFTLMWTLSLALILGTQIILPIVSKKNVRLGVTFPKESLREKRLLKILDQFRTQTLLWGIVLGVGMILLTFLYPKKILLHIILLLLYLLVLYGIYLKYHRELRILKENCHLHLQEEKITVDLKYARDKLNSKILYWHLIPLAILVFSGLVLWLKYPDMPEQVPVHWDFHGKADRYAEKSIFTVFAPLFIGLLITFFIWIGHYGILRSKQGLNSQNEEKSLKRLQIARKYWGVFMIFENIFSSFIFAEIIGMSMGWIKNSFIIFTTTMIGVLGTLFLIFFIAFRVGNTGEKISTENLEEEDINLSEKDDDNRWIGGIFYNNPEDASVFVPKKVGIGFTVNIGSLGGKLVLAFTLVFVLICLLLPWIFK